MRPDEVHRDAVEAAHAWRDEERERGGWLSGSCANDRPGTFLVFEDRPADSVEPPVVREGNVVWIDTGSGPGFSIPDPDEEVDRG